jgi:hypothetical protein
MTWEEVMRRVLPPVDGLSPHITSEFGATNRPAGSTNPHKGVDFNYAMGRAGINLTNPVLRSPAAGIVTNAGEGNVGRIAIRDANGFSHEILHTHTQSVKKGDLVGVGTPIGTMGNRGVAPVSRLFSINPSAARKLSLVWLPWPALSRFRTCRQLPTVRQTLPVVLDNGLRSLDSGMSALRLRNSRPTRASDRKQMTARRFAPFRGSTSRRLRPHQTMRCL